MLRMSDFATIVFAAAAVYVAFVTYKLQRKQHAASTLQFLSDRWGVYNSRIIEDKALQEFEAGIHPHGKLTSNDIKKLYYYFDLLNQARLSMHKVWLDDLDVATGNADISLVANLLYGDRDFVRDHAFPRGYVHLPAEIEKRWAYIDEKNGEAVPMDMIFTLPKPSQLQRLLGIKPF